ncbi:MAG: tetratricopeptide repeat protein, partial [Desulfobacterales bacterium]|nr:tetratricopeptide repeat protein [Desulfobacterales bacterium]
AGMELAELLSETNRAPGALTILRALQKNHPAFPDAYNLEARLLMAAKDIPAARDALDRGLKYNPDNPDLLKRRAREEGGKKTSTANDRE